ncbi:MAG: caspase family protein [Chitinophagaceae bacterium]|nr:caspase family protein [Chitinophagaceae bacterium]
MRKHFIITLFFIHLLLNSFSQPKLIVPGGHVRDITCMDISPDENYLITGSNDRTVKLWELSSGKLVHEFPVFSKWILNVKYSPDGNFILVTDGDNKISIFDSETFLTLQELRINTYIKGFAFTPDSKGLCLATTDSLIEFNLLSARRRRAIADRIEVVSYNRDQLITINLSSEIIIRDAKNWQEKKRYKIGERIVRYAFSDDETLLGCVLGDSTVAVTDLKSGRVTTIYKGNELPGNCKFSNDNRRLFFNTKSGTLWMAELQSIGKDSILINGNPGSYYSEKIISDPKGETVFITQGAVIYKVDFINHTKVLLEGHSDDIADLRMLSAGLKAVSISRDKTAIVWNTETGRPAAHMTGKPLEKLYFRFSPSGKYFFNFGIKNKNSDYLEMDVWRVSDCKKLITIPNIDITPFPVFSDVEGIIYCNSKGDSSLLAVDANTGTIINRLRYADSGYLKNIYAGESNGIIISFKKGSFISWDAVSGNIRELNSISADFKDGFGSDRITDPSGKYRLEMKGEICRWIKIIGGEEVFSWKAEMGGSFHKAVVSSDGTRIYLADNSSWIKIIDARTGIILKKISAFNFEPDPTGKLIAIENWAKITFYSINDLRPLINLLSIDSLNYIVYDEESRYDGTKAAREALYFSCGKELINLSQVKDQLWVPGLAERIMQGDKINGKTISELEICGLTPQVDQVPGNSGYSFIIRPRRGGLGETVVLVNGIETIRLKASELKKENDNYRLDIGNEELKKYFISGGTNQVTVKSFIASNEISSRGVIVSAEEKIETTPPPNLYAVMIGVSDYKGLEMDLKYAAKDASDLSSVLKLTASKFFNADGADHVFIYDLTTGSRKLPEKKTIKETLGEIGAKAKANDILFIFFAGHGVVSEENDKKQFYFLTADASSLSTTDAVKEVGISTAELTEWIRPQNNKAQKRILIYDACNSGQLIKDFVRIGNDGQDYLSARDDDKAQQTKAIDKLNESSGLFILSASASSQNAYELGRISQGVLTYSLLRAIKLQPEALEEEKYLNVSRWFNVVKKTVSDIARENGARQDPQVISNTDFNIGIVDTEVIGKINLPSEKPLFVGSNFQNSDDAIADDDLELSKLVNVKLGAISSRGTESGIVFMTNTNSPDAWSLTGRYEITGNNVLLKANLKQNRVIKQRFEVRGTKDKLGELAALVAEKGAQLVK